MNQKNLKGREGREVESKVVDEKFSKGGRGGEYIRETKFC